MALDAKAEVVDRIASAMVSSLPQAAAREALHELAAVLREAAEGYPEAFNLPGYGSDGHGCSSGCLPCLARWLTNL